MSMSNRRVSMMGLMLMLALSVWAPVQSHAQSGQLCFNVPGITNCIQGRFLEYWRDNGGLPVFGYPITAEFREKTPEGEFTVQYFERNVLEYHPEKARPYDVLLGRLGDTRLKQLGRDWFAEPKGTQTPGCNWSAQTSHSVCGDFKAYWESHGLNDPKLDKAGRSLQLFGLPLTEPKMETNQAGDTVMTQWFERARLEFHPGKGILLGLLGNETRTVQQTPVPSPLPSPKPQPNNACANIAAPVDAYIEPNCVKYGDEFYVEVGGFDPDQSVGFWITDEKGLTIGSTQTVKADANGELGGFIDTTDYFGYELRPGNYVFVVQDAEGKYRPSTAPFRVIP
jgi:hypothetical protein